MAADDVFSGFTAKFIKKPFPKNKEKPVFFLNDPHDPKRILKAMDDDDQEMFCELNFNDHPELLKVQLRVAKNLAEKSFRERSQAITIKRRQKKYAEKVKALEEKLEGKKPEEENSDEITQENKPAPAAAPAPSVKKDIKNWFKARYAELKKGQGWHYWQGVFTSFRLLILRVNRVSVFSGGPNDLLLKAFLNFGGLSYFISVAIDLGELIYEFFKPLYQVCKRRYKGQQGRPDDWSEKEKNSSVLKVMAGRFWEALLEEGRIFRMVNDIVWGSINLAGIIFGAKFYIVTMAALNIGGFAFDVCWEALMGLAAYWKFSVLHDHIKDVLKRHEPGFAAINRKKLEIEYSKEVLARINSKNPDLDKELAELDKEYELLQQEHENDKVVERKLYEQLYIKSPKNKFRSFINSIVPGKIRNVFGVTLILAGMYTILLALIYKIPAGQSVGAALACCGSIIYGAGIRTFNYLMERKDWVMKFYNYYLKEKVDSLKNKISNYFKEKYSDYFAKKEEIKISEQQLLIHASINEAQNPLHVHEKNALPPEELTDVVKLSASGNSLEKSISGPDTVDALNMSNTTPTHSPRRIEKNADQSGSRSLLHVTVSSTGSLKKDVRTPLAQCGQFAKPKRMVINEIPKMGTNLLFT